MRLGWDADNLDAGDPDTDSLDAGSLDAGSLDAAPSIHIPSTPTAPRPAGTTLAIRPKGGPPAGPSR